MHGRGIEEGKEDGREGKKNGEVKLSGLKAETASSVSVYKSGNPAVGVEGALTSVATRMSG